MTKIQNPIIGRASQQAGGMVFSTVYGQNVMRAKPFNILQKNSPAQQKYKSRFVAGNELASKVKVYQNLIFPLPPIKYSKYNLMFKQILSSFVYVNGQWQIKPSLLIMGSGTLPDVYGSYNFNSIVAWTLRYTYISEYYDTLTDENDEVYCLIKDHATNTDKLIQGIINVNTHTFTFDIPEVFQNTACFVSEPFILRKALNNSNKFIFSKSDTPIMLELNP